VGIPITLSDYGWSTVTARVAALSGWLANCLACWWGHARTVNLALGIGLTGTRSPSAPQR
jgi:hypothetical protein